MNTIATKTAREIYVSSIIHSTSNKMITTKEMTTNILKRDPSIKKTFDTLRRDITNIASYIADIAPENVECRSETFPLWVVKHIGSQWFIRIEASKTRISIEELTNVMDQLMEPGIVYNVNDIVHNIAKKFIKRFVTIKEYMTDVLSNEPWTEKYNFYYDNKIYKVKRLIKTSVQPELPISNNNPITTIIEPAKTNNQELKIQLQSLIKQAQDILAKIN